MNWLIDNIWLTPVYPLVSALLIILLRGMRFGPRKLPLMQPKMGAAFLTWLATGFGLCHALAAIVWLFAQGDHVVPIERNWDWLTAGDLTFSVGYLLDSMSVMMLFVVTFISLFIQIYTHGYMRHDEAYAKFFAFLSLFNFAMLGLVLSTNIFQIYIFWELVGVCSYLLIGFWSYKKEAGDASIKAFLMNRVGDFGFLIGILTLGYVTLIAGNFWSGYLQQNPEQAIFSFQGFEQMSQYILREGGMGAIPIAPALGEWMAAFGAAVPTIGEVLLATIAILLFFGPMAKSAQVPLHTWLPDAMAGPTPISALIHAATMVAAGVYLVGRAYPVFFHSELAMTVVVVIGLLTAVIGATIALVQTDIKKALAYSTMSQLGFMVTAMGLGAFTAGLFHLFTHAFFKAMLFLCSGSVIHACEDEQDMRHMGGLRKYLPLTHIAYLVGCIAISGLFWTSGFWSKDEILVGAQGHVLFGIENAAFYILAGAAMLTAFYMFRTYFMTFWGEYRGHHHVHHEDPVLAWPLIVLAVPSLLIGWFLSGNMASLPSFAGYINYVASGAAHGAAHAHHAPAFFSPVAIQSQMIGLAGLIGAILLYSPWAKLNPDSIRRAASPLYTLFENKWYWDHFYGFLVKNGALVWARWSAVFDQGVIDGVVNWTGRTIYQSGAALRTLHMGKIQTYIAVAFFGLVMLTLALIYWMI